MSKHLKQIEGNFLGAYRLQWGGLAQTSFHFKIRSSLSFSTSDSNANQTSSDKDIGSTTDLLPETSPSLHVGGCFGVLKQLLLDFNIFGSMNPILPNSHTSLCPSRRTTAPVYV